MTASSKAKTPKLTLVSDDIYHFNRKPETPVERIRRLQLEARMLAREQIEAMERQMRALAEQARELSIGGDAYPAGVREMASRLADDLDARALTIDAVMDRIPLPSV